MTSETFESGSAAPDMAPVADKATAARNSLVINVLLVSTFVVMLNETAMTVAIPHLMKALNVPASSAQWLTTAFLLTMAVVIPITGFMLQRINTRPIYILAMSIFSAGTLICALSPGLELLVFGRIIQAVGTAIMMPLLMTTVMTLVPPSSRGKTMGNISIVISVAPAIGPTISGVILSVLEWRWMFILVLPIAVGSLLLGAWRMQNVTEPRPAPLDVVSVVLSALGFGGLVYGLSTLGEGGDAALPAWVPLVLGVAALAVFVRRQTRLQRADRALLDLRTFRSRVFTMSTAVLAVSMMALFGTLIVLPIYLQTVHGLDPLGTGLLLLPGGLVKGLLAPFVGRVYDRSGPTVLLVPGSILLSASLWYLASTTGATPVPMVLLAHVVLSAGLFVVTAAWAVGVRFERRVTQNRAGQVSSIKDRGSAVAVAGEEYDAVVIASGAWLNDLARPFGVSVPVQAGRGYSFTVPIDPVPQGPVYFPAQRLACTPVGDRLRIAGMMEFRSPDAPLDPRRIKAIVDAAIEVKLREAMKVGVPKPLTTRDLLAAAGLEVPQRVLPMLGQRLHIQGHRHQQLLLARGQGGRPQRRHGLFGHLDRPTRVGERDGHAGDERGAMGPLFALAGIPLLMISGAAPQVKQLLVAHGVRAPEVAYETTFCATHRLTKDGRPVEPPLPDAVLRRQVDQLEVVVAEEEEP